jgi:tripartite ATP-independent transporter DctP family solute receptor
MRKAGRMKGICFFLAAVLLVPGIAFAQQVKIKLATVEPADINASPALAAAVVFKHKVEAEAGNRVKVDIFPAGQLGGERELMEGLRMGTVEMAIASDGPVGGFFAPILVLGIPYAFPSNVVAWRVLDGPFGQELMENLRQKIGVRCLAVSENGFRHFTNNVRPIKRPADMKGLKIRTMENPSHMAIVRALGGDPTPISFGELYSSLQQKIVDGQENPVSVLYMIKGYEVQKYMTLDGHVYNPSFIWINDKVFEKLDPQTKGVFREAAIKASFVKRAGVAVAEATRLEEMMKKGLQVYNPTPAEKEAFKKATQQEVIKSIEKKVGKEWIDKMFSSIDQAGKDVRSGK